MSSLELTSHSPLTGRTAQFVTENDCSYLYVGAVNHHGEFHVYNACWVKNHKEVSEDYNEEKDMDEGIQPLLSAKFISQNGEYSFFNEEHIHFVWGKDGMSVSLFYKNELICISPYWADEEMPGYSLYSVNKSMKKVPMSLSEKELEEYRGEYFAAKDFWEQDFASYWDTYLQGLLEELEQYFGESTRYFAIDNGEFPNKSIVLFETGEIHYAFTIGLGMYPQPTAMDIAKENPNVFPYMELGFAWDGNLEFDEMKALGAMSSTASLPWNHELFLTHHHFVGLPINDNYQVAVLADEELIGYHSIPFLKERKVHLLWQIPINKETLDRLETEKVFYEELSEFTKRENVILKEL